MSLCHLCIFTRVSGSAASSKIALLLIWTLFDSIYKSRFTKDILLELDSMCWTCDAVYCTAGSGSCSHYCRHAWMHKLLYLAPALPCLLSLAYRHLLNIQYRKEFEVIPCFFYVLLSRKKIRFLSLKPFPWTFYFNSWWFCPQKLYQINKYLFTENKLQKM